MAIPPEEPSQADFSLPAIAVSTEIDLLILNSPLESLHKDVVKTSFSARPADLDLLCLQPGQKLDDVN